MKIEDKSDELDARIVAISAKDYGRQRLRTILIMVTLVFVVVGFVSMFVVLHQITAKTNFIVSSQIPGLQAQIRARDKTISDQQYILEKEAIPAIVKLAKQVKDLGGDPGQIVLSPPKR